jgi:hypothetical protein
MTNHTTNRGLTPSQTPTNFFVIDRSYVHAADSTLYSLASYEPYILITTAEREAQQQADID